MDDFLRRLEYLKTGCPSYMIVDMTSEAQNQVKNRGFSVFVLSNKFDDIGRQRVGVYYTEKGKKDLSDDYNFVMRGGFN